MNRAMFSGVAGMKTHQSKMDVIGNNIANVNTYGYKSQRAVFSDIFYQTVKSASGGTTSRGGTNPSSIGYGSSLAAVQTMMTQSSMQNTGFGLDVAIMGEGYLQVMDADGNIFYTKAGLLDYDSNGYLTDINGNFVLGATSADADPDSQKIRLDNVGAVSSQVPSVSETINGIEYTISASNATEYGNVAITIGSSDQLPAGLKAQASISATGAITVLLNSYEQFSSLSELNSVMNQAITEANGGKQHVGGTFTLETDQNLFGTDAVSGTWTGAALAEAGKLTPTNASGLLNGALSIGTIALANPIADGNTSLTLASDGATPENFTLTMGVGGTDYSYTFAESAMPAQGATITLAEAGGTGTIQLTVDNSVELQTQAANVSASGTANSPVTQTAPKYFLGGATITSISSDFIGSGAMDFSFTTDATTGAIATVTATISGKTYTGTVSGNSVTLETASPLDGTITMNIPSVDTIKANLGLPTAATAAEVITALAGSEDNHAYVAVPQQAAQSMPLTGAEIAGTDFGITPGEVTGATTAIFGGNMYFSEPSSDFVGDGTLDNFGATYVDDGTNPPSWDISFDIGGVPYSASITENTLSGSILLKSPNGDYIEATNPGFEEMSTYFTQLNPGVAPTNGVTVAALTGADSLTATPSTPSRDLGLSSISFGLTDGTEGGAVTLDQLSSIAIGTDGTVSVNHAQLGSVVVGKISLASFANSRGLQLEGTNYFSATANSGEPQLADPGSDGTGGLKSSALEMSNVDLSAEFADMITTQRGFQANSRVITVSDTMLEELINLKR